METEKRNKAKKGKRKTQSVPERNRIIHENIQAIILHRQKIASRRTTADILADRITDFSGRVIFVLIHAVWFVVWFALNSGWFGLKPFDPYPFGLLTMIVSLEAIFLSTFILISQNQMSQRDQERAELDLQINLLTERELTRVLIMLNQIERHMGITHSRDKELAELVKETNPEEVLKQIEKEEQEETSDRLS